MIYSLHKQYFQSGEWMRERWHTFWTHMFREDMRSSAGESVDLALLLPAVWLIVWYFYMWKTYTLLMCWACFALLWRWETAPCVDLLTPRSPYGHPNGVKEKLLFFLPSSNAKLALQSGVKGGRWKIKQKPAEESNFYSSTVYLSAILRLYLSISTLYFNSTVSQSDFYSTTFTWQLLVAFQIEVLHKKKTS